VIHNTKLRHPVFILSNTVPLASPLSLKASSVLLIS
jgi:hypothetical protein